MRVALDITPMLGPRTGIGTYTAHLAVGVLATLGADDLVPVALGRQPVAGLAAHGLEGTRVVRRGIPARILHRMWQRVPFPTAETLVGRVDVWHATNYVAPPTRRAGVVLTVHDLTYLRHPQFVSASTAAYRRLVPAAIARGAVVCTDSRAVAAEVIQEYAVPADRVHVARLGVDPVWFDEPEPAAGGFQVPTEPYLLALGTLEPRKNLAVLLEAYRLAERAGRPLPTLVLAGAPGWGPPLELAGLPAQRVRVTGHLPFAAVHALVHGAGAMVFPSLYEGFGLPPLEALASGTPVLASDLPVTREVLGEQAAYLPDPRSPEGVLDALTETLAAPVGTPESRRAHARGFRWEDCVNATLAAYRHAAEDR